MITGTVLLREGESRKEEIDEEYQLMLVCGVIKVPKSLGIKGECQYAICSNRLAEEMCCEMPNTFSLSLSKKIFRDFSKEKWFTGGHMGDFWEMPIWKV